LVKPSNRVIGAASIVTLGFFLGVTPSSSAFNLSYSNLTANTSVSLKSLFYGFLSSLFIAIHAVLIKSSLPHCNNSTIHLAWWTNAGSAVFLAPFVLLTGEIGTLRELVATQTMNGQPWTAHTFIYGSLVTGFFGFLLCIAGLLSIKVTSPVTHMFSSVRV
jgi:solute carrier family 35 (GDP-fucose transporter), member C1